MHVGRKRMMDYDDDQIKEVDNTRHVVKVKLSLCLNKHHIMKMHLLIMHHAMKTYWESGGIASRPSRFNPGGRAPVPIR
jgi:hypothetical protein